MKKTLLVILTALLLFTTACSGGGESRTTTIKDPITTTTPVSPVPSATTLPPQATTTISTTALADPIPELAKVVKLDSLIPEGHPTDDTYHAKTDYPYLTAQYPYITFNAETDEYYLFAGHFLMRVNPETMEATPVCAKEGCLHYKEQDLAKKAECYAMCSYDIVYPTIHYYNGRLYIAHNAVDSLDYVLTSISIDGTDRRTEFQLANSSEFDSTMTETGCAGSTILHRGMIYYTWLQPIGGDRYSVEVWTYAVEKPEKEPQCIFRSENSNIANSDKDLTAYGTRLYLSCFYTESGVDYIEVGNGGTLEQKNETYILDLLTGEWTTVEAPEGYDIKALQILDGSVMLSCQPLDTLEQYYDTRREESAAQSEEEAEDLPSTGTVYTPGDYVRFQLTLDGHDPVRQENVPGDSDNRFAYSDENCFYEYEEKYGVPDSEMLYVYDMEGNLLAQRSLADLLRRDYEYKGDSYKVETSMLFCNLYPLAAGKTIMYINEAGSWSSNRFERVTYYCIDTSDAANGNVELQELFSCDEYDYNSNKASGRWK